MMIFLEVTEKECVNERYTPALDSGNSICTTMSGRLSNRYSMSDIGLFPRHNSSKVTGSKIKNKFGKFHPSPCQN